MTSTLGSVRQWLVEWTVSGAALGAGVPALAVVAIAVMEPGQPDRVLKVLLSFAVVGGLAGALIGALAAGPVHLASGWLWTRVHPGLALVLGPLLGAAGGGVLAPLLVAGPLGEGSSARALTIAALAGSCCAGLTLAPMWVAYLALHARGRNGWGALGVAVVWAPAAVAVTLGTLILRLG